MFSLLTFCTNRWEFFIRVAKPIGQGRRRWLIRWTTNDWRWTDKFARLRCLAISNTFHSTGTAGYRYTFARRAFRINGARRTPTKRQYTLTMQLAQAERTNQNHKLTFLWHHGDRKSSLNAHRNRVPLKNNIKISAFHTIPYNISYTTIAQWHTKAKWRTTSNRYDSE